MKKSIVFVVLPFLLTACDFSSFLPSAHKAGNNSIENGIRLNLHANDPLQIKQHNSNDTFGLDVRSPTFSVSNSTIKLLDGKITFYQTPVMGDYQLREVGDMNPQYLFYEMQIDFNYNANKTCDFVYLTEVSFGSNANESKLFTNLRVALFDKATMNYYYSFSYDEKGTVTQTECELDLDADGVMEGTYTTGMPSYMTDNYNIVIPSENEIDSDNIPHGKDLIPFNKTLTLRVWVEGWDLSNNDIVENFGADIDIRFAGHIAK